MKLWGVLGFVGYIGVLNAESDNSIEVPDEKPGIGVISHVEESSSQEDTEEEEVKIDPSSLLKEVTDNVTLPQEQEEVEKPEPYLIVPTDSTSPPGGGVRLIDPKIEKLFPPLKEIPWWERWWNAITSWFSDERSDTDSIDR